MKRVAVAWFLAGVACSRSSSPPGDRSTDYPMGVGAATALVDAGPPPLAGLKNPDWIEPVRSGDTEIGKATLPLGATSPRPWILALHGAGDRAEWACSEWIGAAAGYAFVICPKGNASGLYWDDAASTATQIDEAVAVLGTERAPYFMKSEPVVAGFSAGANVALALLEQKKLTASHVVLVEGAFGAVVREDFPDLLKKWGVRRVLLACTTRGTCPETYRDAMSRLHRAGIDVRVNLAGAARHGMWNEVIVSIRRDWPWLVSDLPGWETFAIPTSDVSSGETLLPDP